MYQTILPSAYTSFTGVSTTAVPPWYFYCCFPLAFLEGYSLFLSLAAISLHLDPTTWDPSALSRKAAFSSSISSWSC